MERDELLRTYGIVPKRSEPPRQAIRSRLTGVNIFGQWLAFLMFGVSPLLLAILLLIVVPILEVRLGLAAFFGFFGLVVGFLIARDVNEWVELDGNLIRWKHLFTRLVDERPVSELESIETLTLAFRTPTVKIVEGMYGRIKGFEFRFANMKQGIKIFRADPTMTNVRELLEGVISRMYENGEVVPVIKDFEGTPLIRRLTLKRH
jgi:hypothetical protein